LEYPFPSITPPYPNKPICNYNTSFYTKIKSTKELQQNINVSDKGVIKDEKKKIPKGYQTRMCTFAERIGWCGGALWDLRRRKVVTEKEKKTPLSPILKRWNVLITEMKMFVKENCCAKYSAVCSVFTILGFGSPLFHLMEQPSLSLLLWLHYVKQYHHFYLIFNLKFN